MIHSDIAHKRFEVAAADDTDTGTTTDYQRLALLQLLLPLL
jgi:hypothetical protein